MRSDETYLALTAGHILEDIERELIVKGHGGEIALQVAQKSVRVNGRPIGRMDESVHFRDDCAFLKIPPSKLSSFHHRIPCVNPHHYDVDKPAVEKPGDPLYLSRRGTFDDLLAGDRHIIVYKQGASTGLTMGFFEEILLAPPLGWYSAKEEDDEDDEDDDASDDDQDDNEWLGNVRWINPDLPFSDSGDSGSLVFAKENGVTIPLGIHIGAPASTPFHSVFISIETFCFEAEREGWELTFTGD
jgi:hypothetical protein